MQESEEKRPPTGGGAIYPQTGPSHACVEATEEVGGVLGALGEAQDPRRIFCVHAKPLSRKSATRPPEVRYASLPSGAGAACRARRRKKSATLTG
jgi:hypothetical protein